VDEWHNLVLYDGECGLCDRTVQWLLRHDRRGVLTYAPLQGETARPFVANVPGDKRELDTLVFVERSDDGAIRVTDRSRGVFRILGTLGGFWRVVSWLRFLPRFLTDLGYRIVAKNRIRWFGRVDACRVPDAAVRQRFLA
jgi:predicted DCC family thiol-disulfide oxidoreductase YuxK